MFTQVGPESTTNDMNVTKYKIYSVMGNTKGFRYVIVELS